MSIEKAFLDYHAPKPVGEIDMIKEVRSILSQSGLDSQLPFYDGSRFIQEGQNKTYQVQRHCLNRFWTLQLLNAKEESSIVRQNLVDRGDPDIWFKCFKEKVLPFVVRHKLPV